MRAYDEIYLDEAMKNLGDAFDYAKNDCDINLDDFLLFFISSKIAKCFERGNPKYVVGISGIELAIRALEETSDKKVVDIEYRFEKSKEYWCGYILAYFQWYHNLSFKKIKEYLSMDELLKMYNPLHEASDQKAIDVIKQRIINKNNKTLLQKRRINNGLSQNELSRKSGVSLRMIQQYEQRQKDINKASVSSLKAISDVLYCDIEDLMEIRFND